MATIFIRSSRRTDRSTSRRHSRRRNLNSKSRRLKSLGTYRGVLDSHSFHGLGKGNDGTRDGDRSGLSNNNYSGLRDVRSRSDNGGDGGVGNDSSNSSLESAVGSDRTTNNRNRLGASQSQSDRFRGNFSSRGSNSDRRASSDSGDELSVDSRLTLYNGSGLGKSQRGSNRTGHNSGRRASGDSGGELSVDSSLTLYDGSGLGKSQRGSDSTRNHSGRGNFRAGGNSLGNDLVRGGTLNNNRNGFSESESIGRSRLLNT